MEGRRKKERNKWEDVEDVMETRKEERKEGRKEEVEGKKSWNMGRKEGSKSR